MPQLRTLAKAVADAGMGDLGRLLQYKARWYRHRRPLRGQQAIHRLWLRPPDPRTGLQPQAAGKSRSPPTTTWQPARTRALGRNRNKTAH